MEIQRSSCKLKHAYTCWKLYDLGFQMCYFMLPWHIINCVFSLNFKLHSPLSAGDWSKMHIFAHVYMGVMIKIMFDTAFPPPCLCRLVLSVEQWGIFKELWFLKCPLVSEVVGEFAVCRILKTGLCRAHKYSWPIVVFWGVLLFFSFIAFLYKEFLKCVKDIHYKSSTRHLPSSKKKTLSRLLRSPAVAQLSSLLYALLLCQHCGSFVTLKKALVL